MEAQKLDSVSHSFEYRCSTLASDQAQWRRLWITRGNIELAWHWDGNCGTADRLLKISVEVQAHFLKQNLFSSGDSLAWWWCTLFEKWWHPLLWLQGERFRSKAGCRLIWARGAPWWGRLWPCLSRQTQGDRLDCSFKVYWSQSLK